MPIVLADVFGSPNIGVYCFCNDQVAMVPPGLPERKVDRFRECLGTEICVTNVGGSSLLGALVAANSNGILLPHIVRDHELKSIRSKVGLRVEIAHERWTAFGNVILANDYGALAHPGLPRSLAEKVSDALGVDVVTGRLANLPYVGSLGVATNKGALVHPSATVEERRALEGVLKVPVQLGTVNGGVPYVKAGLIANTTGAVVGPLTRGPELMAITRFLGVE